MKRVFLSFLHENTWAVNQFRAVIGDEYVDAMAYGESPKGLETTRNRRRRDLFDAQDAIDAQRDGLIKRIEKQLSQHQTLKPVFTFRWRLA
jgi:hypothetical protein